jgi:uncharacterized protein (DUF2225 family)
MKQTIEIIKCDICGTQFEPKERHVTHVFTNITIKRDFEDTVEYNDVCPACNRSLINHLDTLKTGRSNG